MIQVIMSGGQTGADRAALDFAIAKGIPHDGWCPRGRKAEDGPLSAIYKLTETETAEYPKRTEKNVQHSNGTIIFNRLEGLERGSALTERMCIKHSKPCLILIGYGLERVRGHALNIEEFIKRHMIERLNIAGNRESKAPGIYDHVYAVLCTMPSSVFFQTVEYRWTEFLGDNPPTTSPLA